MTWARRRACVVAAAVAVAGACAQNAPLKTMETAVPAAVSATQCDPVPALVRSSRDRNCVRTVRVFDVGPSALYAAPPPDDNPRADAYRTDTGWAMRARHWATAYPFETLDLHALSIDAPWVLAYKNAYESPRAPAVIVRELSEKLNRPVQEASGVVFPIGTLDTTTSCRLFLSRLSDASAGHSALQLARGTPRLLGPFWAYLSVAADELRRFHARTPNKTSAELLGCFSQMEGALGRLMMPVPPNTEDREVLGLFLRALAVFSR